MNPFSILINYVIANSRASFYNVSGNQEITNTAILAGVVSENPLLNYLIIENKAKIEGDKFIADKSTDAGRGAIAGGSTTTTDNAGASKENTSTENTAVTLQSLEAKISDSTSSLESQITTSSEKSRNDLDKFIAETFNPRIEGLEKSNIELKNVIKEIKDTLERISKTASASDISTASDQKSIAKNVKK